MVNIKTPADIEAMRPACRHAADTLVMIEAHIRPGISTDDINDLVHDFTIKAGAIPAPLNYHGFPKSVCTSVNHVVCHGIPTNKVLKDGDIVNVDVTSIIDGWHGDTSKTFYVGEPSIKARKVTEVARKALEIGIAMVRPGITLGDIGHAIQLYVESEKCSVVREYCGHGIGRNFHEEPQVLHFGNAGSGLRLQPGLVFTIEPMVNLGKKSIKLLGDGWTVVTRDKSLSAQFEHTLAVTETGVDILTLPST
ncbi:MAG: type I methionyl aminopeptidase [Zetaproteobacteria bacterium CG06_land_8_20_14_3_00_59_53]|nr:MAG: type I methionyl aminopeptidase [Zetaproteobacteria bacterium CG2_30_59_37]PIO89292.1 MAG: type I methionyl aminopeptidase [Zetaproteobacteria bacterium CG23_combo_of_CG06-09_8_20_14_all_59_86]PIQ65362.1 MAG: type I methionyl aminopeptidase [Zetaproteobacteria bacterium CG11_big_fil_rev_8_21_14_0_20_59_439]PIU70592.1 MAG: type I methionyl aminopeptidase [Zetaproteobacteria bacterium CG06_land_8_20_14_3_00_59_53]PIU98140.1 MAG: type I methionyl aminopeptidase [Zetaproteobacteria bacteriu